MLRALFFGQKSCGCILINNCAFCECCLSGNAGAKGQWTIDISDKVRKQAGKLEKHNNTKISNLFAWELE